MSVYKLPGITALLPLLRAHCPAMVKHGADIIKQITCAVNPGQIIFILYAISKKIQWTLPHAYVVLHIEMTMLAAIGDWVGVAGHPS